MSIKILLSLVFLQAIYSSYLVINFDFKDQLNCIDLRGNREGKKILVDKIKEYSALENYLYFVKMENIYACNKIDSKKYDEINKNIILEIKEVNKSQNLKIKEIYESIKLKNLNNIDEIKKDVALADNKIKILMRNISKYENNIISVEKIQLNQFYYINITKIIYIIYMSIIAIICLYLYDKKR